MVRKIENVNGKDYIERKFWRYVDKSGDCWVWTRPPTHNGYGRLAFGGRLHRRVVLAHRMSWELSRGPIPSGMFVLHKCDNRLCVRPEHLWLGTRRDNALDMVRKGRSAFQLYPERYRAEWGSGSKLTWENVIAIRKRWKAMRKRKIFRGQESMAKIAKDFGITSSLVGYVVRYKIWKPAAKEILDEFDLYQMESG